jgi:hypothetical protein
MRTISQIIFVVFFLVSCSTAGKLGKSEKLSNEQKGKNTFVNTTILATGTVLLSASEDLPFDAADFKPFFEEKMKKADLADLDRAIKDLGPDVFADIDELLEQMHSTMDDVKVVNPDIYANLFGGELMQKGVRITEKHKLPYGFLALSQELSPTEIHRYFIYFLANNDDTESSIFLIFNDLAKWVESDTFQNDADLKKLIKVLED